MTAKGATLPRGATFQVLAAGRQLLLPTRCYQAINCGWCPASTNKYRLRRSGEALRWGILPR